MRATIKTLIGATVLSLAAQGGAFAQSELLEEARDYFKPIPHAVPSVKGNTITREKIDLGRKLFMDPRLSLSGLLSCNSCHNLGMGGDDNLETSIGHGWQKGPRNAPTVLNAVFNLAQFWDGRAEDLKAQAKGPVQAGVEMASTPERVEAVLNSMPGYVDDFNRAFPGEENTANFDNMAKAIEAFEATLITPASKFDLFLEGNENALDATEKQGLQVFMDAGCAACHAGVNIGGEGYYAFGVIEKPGADILPANDKGRFAVTQTAEEEYVFRASPLRNIELTAPYFHSGKVWDLKQAVAIMASSQLGEELSDADIDAVVAFLKTLTGEQPVVEYPILPVRTDSTPLPDPSTMTAH